MNVILPLQMDPSSFLETYDTVREEIDSVIGTKLAIVFLGFSGKGYKDLSQVRSMVIDILNKHLSNSTPNSLIVVCGATGQGIGICYELAKKMEIRTLGIVSDQINKEDLSVDCDHLIEVQRPKQDWRVLDSQGASYMVYSASKPGGCVYALGGGEVAISELNEAKDKGLTTIKYEFEPAR